MNPMIENLMKTISPSMGLGMLRIGIEKRLGKKIAAYDMVYLSEKEEIIFGVPMDDGRYLTEKYTSSGKDKIIFIIKSLCKAKLKDGETIDVVKLKYTLTGTSIEMGVTFKDGSKTMLTHKL